MLGVITIALLIGGINYLSNNNQDDTSTTVNENHVKVPTPFGCVETVYNEKDWLAKETLLQKIGLKKESVYCN